jgi:hypothetical protein
MRLTALTSLIAALTIALLPAVGKANETVFVCDIYGDAVASAPSPAGGISATVNCPGDPARSSYTPSNPPGGLAIWTYPNHTVSNGAAVNWAIHAPTGLTIASVYIPHMYSNGIDDGSGWGGGFFWQGGSGGVTTWDGESGWSSFYGGSPHFTWPSGGTPYFGWRVVCGASPCTNGGNQWLSVELLELGVQETTAPVLGSWIGLWPATGWVRGTWTLEYGGDSPSGLCTLSGTLAGQAVPGSSVRPQPAVWHQCSAPAVDAPVDTAQYGQGALPLALTATDAAGQTASMSKTVYVDNEAPTVSLSGPTDAPTTAGVQYITATAGAGPSGVAGISCSVDGSPTQWHAGASEQIALAGVGVHHVTCTSENHARDSSGNPAVSQPASWTLSIREPSVSSVAFERAADALSCRRARERVQIPAHWVKAFHRGHAVRVRLPAQTRAVQVVHCHPHVITRRVLVNGRWVTQRVVELPHAALVTSKEATPGQRTTVSGWLGTSTGDALAGQPVTVYAAPANGTNHYVPVANVHTARDGSWRAALPPGPSRVVVAVYRGDATVEPSVSAPARVVVPASLAVRIKPTTARWGGRIRITGRLAGGYIPSGGELVVLWVGWRGGKTEIGHVYSRADGRFATNYTFLRGNGTERYRFWVESVRESDYPYAPGRSRAVTVVVRQ